MFDLCHEYQAQSLIQTIEEKTESYCKSVVLKDTYCNDTMFDLIAFADHAKFHDTIKMCAKKLEKTENMEVK